MDSPNNQQGEKKRACDSCRARKIKCSKEAPCENCKKRNRPCTFDRAHSKQSSTKTISIRAQPKIKPIEKTPHNSSLQPADKLVTIQYTPPNKNEIMPPPNGKIAVSVGDPSIGPRSLSGDLDKEPTACVGSSNITRSSTPLLTEEQSQIPPSAAKVPLNAQACQSNNSPTVETHPINNSQKEPPSYEINMIKTLVELEPKIDSLLNSAIKYHPSMVSVTTTAALMRFFRDVNPVFPLFDQEFFIRNLTQTSHEFSAILKSITLLMHLFEQDPIKTKESLQTACQSYINVFGLVPPTLPFFVATFVLHQTLTAIIASTSSPLSS